MLQKALEWGGLFGMTRDKQNGKGIWNWNVRRLYMTGGLKTLQRLEEVWQIRWEKSGTELEVYYTFSVVKEVKVINWKKDS